ncbi:MAG: amino acid permease [Pseudomonadota bacterium]
MATSTKNSPDQIESPIGFWRCWAISVGVMIGSGIFVLPAVLAPYGFISMLGWLMTSIGVIGLAFVLGRLARRTDNGVGGPYAYSRDAFGNLTGFLIGWGYWLSVTIAVTAIALAFAGYLSAILPALDDSNTVKNIIALVAIWTLTAVNIRGVSEAAWVQLILTILKLVPLFVIILLGSSAGSVDTLPAFNPQDRPLHSAVAATALLTMWSFIGVEAAVIPAGNVRDAERTIPRAVVGAAVSVVAVYILVTLAVMMLVPAGTLANSEAPFIDAAKAMGPIGTGIIAFGALVATAGSLNGSILVMGQMPMAMALDGLLPQRFARTNEGHAPVFSLILSSIIASVLIGLNSTGSLIDAFTFLISISTLCVLAPYGVSALAELKHSLSNSRGWALIALLTIAYVVLAASGSGFRILAYGGVLMAVGLPLYFLFKRSAITSQTVMNQDDQNYETR